MAKKKSTNVGTFKYIADAPANPTLLDFPSDEFGLCRELRKTMTKLSGRLCGDQKKLRVAEQNLALLIGHMYNRYREQGGTLPAAVQESSANKQTYTAPEQPEAASGDTAAESTEATESTEQTAEVK